MRAIYELKDRICDELEALGKSGKLDMAVLEKADKLAGTAYHLEKLIRASDGYSEHDSYRGGSYRSSYDGDSWRDVPDGYSRKRDGMGRYSRHGEDSLQERLERMAGTGTDQEREFARRMLSEMR